MAMIPIKLEPVAMSVNSSPQKSLSINQIAAQLASSKAAVNNSPPTIIIAASSASNGVTINGTNNNIEKMDPSITEVVSSNPIVAKMTEALSLKQSPTLTKQLAKPLNAGTTSGMQVKLLFNSILILLIYLPPFLHHHFTLVQMTVAQNLC